MILITKPCNNKNSSSVFDSNIEEKLLFFFLCTAPSLQGLLSLTHRRMIRIAAGSKVTPSVLQEDHHFRTAHPLVVLN